MKTTFEAKKPGLIGIWRFILVFMGLSKKSTGRNGTWFCKKGC